VRSREPVPVRRLQPGVPRDLETVCLKCLQKDPRKRYASAADLADDLGRVREGRPIRARRTPAWERAAKWARRQPWVAGLAAAVVAVAATGYGLVIRELHLTIANTIDTGTIPPPFKIFGVKTFLSGFSNYAKQPLKYRGGSFIFYQDAKEAFKKVEKLAQPRYLQDFVAGVIIHEMAHQLDSTPGHYPDADGDGTKNTLSDYQTVQFDYTQPNQKPPTPLPGYTYQDYFPDFRYGHAWANMDKKTFLLNMHLGPGGFLDKAP
jgi:hypothetical protein